MSERKRGNVPSPPDEGCRRMGAVYRRFQVNVSSESMDKS